MTHHRSYRIPLHRRKLKCHGKSGSRPSPGKHEGTSSCDQLNKSVNLCTSRGTLLIERPTFGPLGLCQDRRRRKSGPTSSSSSRVWRKAGRRPKRLILAGLVSCAGRTDRQAGRPLAADAALAVTGHDHPWVSRGGVKLAHALDHFRDRHRRQDGPRHRRLDRRLYRRAAVARRRPGPCGRCRARSARLETAAGSARHRPRRLNARYLSARPDPRADRRDHLRCELSSAWRRCCRHRWRSPPSRPSSSR